MVMALRIRQPVASPSYPDGRHDAWTQAYNTPELYDCSSPRNAKPFPPSPAKITPARHHLKAHRLQTRGADVR